MAIPTYRYIHSIYTVIPASEICILYRFHVSEPIHYLLYLILLNSKCVCTITIIHWNYQCIIYTFHLQLFCNSNEVLGESISIKMIACDGISCEISYTISDLDISICIITASAE